MKSCPMWLQSANGKAEGGDVAMNGSQNAIQGAVAASGTQLLELRAAVGEAAKALQVTSARM